MKKRKPDADISNTIDPDPDAFSINDKWREIYQGGSEHWNEMLKDNDEKAFCTSVIDHTGLLFKIPMVLQLLAPVKKSNDTSINVLTSWDFINTPVMERIFSKQWNAAMCAGVEHNTLPVDDHKTSKYKQIPVFKVCVDGSHSDRAPKLMQKLVEYINKLHREAGDGKSQRLQRDEMLGILHEKRTEDLIHMLMIADYYEF